jgi:hypothetical protein
VGVASSHDRLSLIELDRFLREHFRKLSSFTNEAFPLLLSVDEDFSRDRKIVQIPAQRTALERFVVVAYHGDYIQVAADAPVAAILPIL